MTEVIIVKNEREAGDIYGRSVADLIKTKPNAVLGLATGVQSARRIPVARTHCAQRAY